MERLWAPWRQAYILSDPPVGCVFCAAWEAPDDREPLVVHRESQAFVLMNRFPYNGGHVLVIPARHAARPADLTPGEWAALTDLLGRTTTIVIDALRAQGANVGMNLGRTAGAGIADHLHFHVVPRWEGDTNFMPLLGDVKVVSEHLVSTWEKLREAFGRVGAGA